MTILAALFIGAIVGELFGAGISGGIAYSQGERGLDLVVVALDGNYCLLVIVINQLNVIKTK